MESAFRGERRRLFLKCKKNTLKIVEHVDLKNVRGSNNYLDASFKSVVELYNSLWSALR